MFKKGSFISGQLSGAGCETNSLEGIYKGDCKDGYPHGRGALAYHNGKMYHGQFKFGKPSGKGEMVQTNGELHSGIFEDGNLEGPGKIINPFEMEILVGNFVQGRLYGRGTLTKYSDAQFANAVQQIVGEFYDSKPHGRVRIETKN